MSLKNGILKRKYSWDMHSYEKVVIITVTLTLQEKKILEFVMPINIYP